MASASPIQRPRLNEDVVPFTEYRRTLNASLSRSIAISRKQFANGECLTEDESFDDIETMLDDMQASRANPSLPSCIMP